MVGLHESLGIDCFWKCSLNKCIRQCRTLKKSAMLKQLTVSFTLVRDSKLDAPSVGAIVIAPRGSPAPGIKYKYTQKCYFSATPVLDTSLYKELFPFLLQSGLVLSWQLEAVSFWLLS